MCSSILAPVSVAHQPTLLGGLPPAPAPDAAWSRVHLDATSWVDVAREWWTGGDTLLDSLIRSVEWRRGRRKMWDRVVDDPRLSCWGRAVADRPDLAAMRRALERHYGRRLRPPGLNFYRDGRDSVAWHSDRELRRLDDTIVAIVTLGTRRPFLVRPKGGGTSVDLAPASGDLVVMGGACQRDWEHTVPKTARAGPRISVSWRWAAPAPPDR